MLLILSGIVFLPLLPSQTPEQIPEVLHSWSRGHYPLETEVLKETLEEEKHIKFDGEVLCPFFLEGGRVTIDNVHYVKEGNLLIPAGMTEFAKDQSFGYHASDLTEYVEEKTNGRYKKEECVPISLEELRANDVNKITDKLMNTHDFQKIIVNATSYEELQVFVQAFVKAAEAGKQFLTRSAASFPKVLGGVSDKPLLKKEELVEDTKNGGIVLIGSQVKKTTLQLEALKQSEKELCFLEFHAEVWNRKDGLKQEAERVRAEAESCIRSGKTAVVYTSRTLDGSQPLYFQGIRCADHQPPYFCHAGSAHCRRHECKELCADR